MNIFEETNPYIVKKGDSSLPIFDITSNDNISLFIPSNSNIKKITLNIKGSGQVSILETCENNIIDHEINIFDNAKVHHSIAFFKDNNEAKYAVNMEKNTEYQGALADFSKGNNILDFVCNLNGEYAKSNWNLACLACENDVKKMSVSFFHNAKHTYAKMENYGVCEDEGSIEFLGTSSINKGAKSSATHQNAKIMVFDPKCKAKANPVLCIDENDVEASHAAVVGQINEDHIFYLTSRGIEEETAKKLITLGYLNPILRFFNDESVLERMSENIDGRF